MGLKLTLKKDKNGLFYDFIDAYWAITELIYNPTQLSFTLEAFPTREAKLKDKAPLDNPSIGYGSGPAVVRSSLYLWQGVFPIDDVFPEGIPKGQDAQYTTVYNFIKEYTELPFEDVFEEGQGDLTGN